MHTPLPRGPEVARPEFPNIAPHAFRGRDFAHFTPQERGIWQSGRWRHESHNGHLGWWWVVGGAWYFYPEPIYPYPTIVSDYLYPVPRIISPQFWYYCDDPPGYYPEVPACYDAWQLIPMSPPAPLPGAIGPEASADIRAGYRIARDVCAACHVVHPTQASASILVQPGPRFEDVANRPDTTIDSLRNFISTTGWDLESRPITMPNQGLSEQSTREVATYILSLRKQH